VSLAGVTVNFYSKVVAADIVCAFFGLMIVSDILFWILANTENRLQRTVLFMPCAIS
jgi:hypothetical protein